MMTVLLPCIARYVVWSLALLAAANTPLALAQAPKPAAPAKAAVSMATYKDPGSGVSFQYPSVWKNLPKTAFDGDRPRAPWGFEPPFLYQATFRPTAILAFPAEGTIFAKTDLDVLYFLFVKIGLAAEQCNAIGDANGGGTQLAPVKIGGLTYAHSTANDDRCSPSNADIYTTYRGGTCYMFELDNFRKCGPDVPGIRKLSASENKALQKHLDDIVQSIRFDTK